jgi:hypothetical protein
MKTVYLTAFFLIVITSFSCTDRDDEAAFANIRIKNTGSFTYSSVQVGSEENIHLNVAPDAYSEYLEYEIAYTYDFIRIEANEETYILQPIDFVGETPLPIGFYTYELAVSETGDVQLTFKVD